LDLFTLNIAHEPYMLNSYIKAYHFMPIVRY